MEKQLQTINDYLSTNFTTMPEALVKLEALKNSDLLKYQAIQILLKRDELELEKEKELEDKNENEQNEENELEKLVTLPESIKVNVSKWNKSLKSSNARKGFPTLTALAKELEGLESFQLFNVEDTEVRITNSNPTDTKIDSYLSIAFIYAEKLVHCKIPVSKFSAVEDEILQGLPFKFSTCEYVETVIDNNEVNYIKYSFAPLS